MRCSRCDKEAHARGLCHQHYMQDRRAGIIPPANYLPKGATLEEAFRHHHPATLGGSGCSLWTKGRNGGGYGQFTLRGQSYLAHVVSYRIHVGPVPEGLCVLHDPVLCTDRACVNYPHLRVGTHKENTADMFIAGTVSRGEHRPLAKLTEADVIAIRQRSASGESYSQLATLYGISKGAISHVVARRSWAHVG